MLHVTRAGLVIAPAYSTAEARPVRGYMTRRHRQFTLSHVRGVENVVARCSVEVERDPGRRIGGSGGLFLRDELELDMDNLTGFLLYQRHISRYVVMQLSIEYITTSSWLFVLLVGSPHPAQNPRFRYLRTGRLTYGQCKYGFSRQPRPWAQLNELRTM